MERKFWKSLRRNATMATSPASAGAVRSTTARPTASPKARSASWNRPERAKSSTGTPPGSWWRFFCSSLNSSQLVVCRFGHFRGQGKSKFLIFSASGNHEGGGRGRGRGRAAHRNGDDRDNNEAPHFKKGSRFRFAQLYHAIQRAVIEEEGSRVPERRLLFLLAGCWPVFAFRFGTVL